MKKCPKCRADIEENARFCLYCMTSLEEKEKIETPKENNRRWLLIIAAALVLVIIFFIVWFAFGKHSSDKKKDTDSKIEVQSEISLVPSPNSNSEIINSSIENTDSSAEINANSSQNNTVISDSSNTSYDVSTESNTTNSTNKPSTNKNSSTAFSSSDKTSTTNSVNKPSSNKKPSSNSTTDDKTSSISSSKPSGSKPTATSSGNESTVTSSVSKPNSNKKPSSDSTTDDKTSSISSDKPSGSKPTATSSGDKSTTTSSSDTNTHNSNSNGSIPADDNTTSTTLPTVTYTYSVGTSVNCYPQGQAPLYAPENVIVITGVSNPAPDGVYIIPETIDGKKVGAIMPSAFCDSNISQTVKSVTLPSTVRTIWGNAFGNCYNLTNIYIKSSVIGIYEDAFPETSKRNSTLTLHCSRDCRNFDFYYYRNIADDYDAEYKEWNG